jgi:hypothetical protein
MHKSLFILYIHHFFLKMLDFKKGGKQEFIGAAKISNESDLS